jgi:hypothetical protein
MKTFFIRLAWFIAAWAAFLFLVSFVGFLFEAVPSAFNFGRSLWF